MKRMTREQKAIIELKNTALYRFAVISGEWDDKATAINTAIDAMWRQIPKPVQKNAERYGTPYWCPECEADQWKVEFITTDGSKPKKVSYCWKCGQAIDWSKEE